MPIARILIFDSGVGGLSILQEIQRQHRGRQLFYASDNEAFPYGIKAESELVERVDDVLHRLQEKTQADIIIVACNTASTVALPRLRERFQQPIIGVVPAIKPAANISQSKVIGLLGTPGTVQRPYTRELIADYASDCDIISVDSSELVLLAEDKLQGKAVAHEQLADILKPFNNPQIDTLVLACTHFPLIKEELQTILPDIHYWIDSGEAIARRLGYWINELQLDKSTPHSATAYFTAETPESRQLEPALAGFGIEAIKYIHSA